MLLQSIGGSDVNRSRSAASRLRSDERQAGVSLLEVVLAGVLLTSLAMGTLLVILPVSRQVRIDRELEVASAEIGEVLEKVQATPFSEIQDRYPDGTQIAVPGLESSQIVITYDDPTADPLVLTAALSWESPDLGPMARTFRTVRTK